MTCRRKKLPGYCGSRQIARTDERSESIQNRPATGSTTKATRPAVPRDSRSA
jgi:hypothetical protein